MNKRIRQFSDESGSAMVAVLFFAIIITLVAGNIAIMGRQDMHLSKYIMHRTVAQQIAEGAASQALGYMTEDAEYVANPPAAVTTGTMGEGTYSVNITTFGTNSFVVEATGTVEGVSRTVKVYGMYPGGSSKAFEKAFFSNSDLRLGGGGFVKVNVQGGDTHSNQNSDIFGNVALDGAATASGTMSVTGAAIVAKGAKGGVDQIEFPQLDFDYYYDIARKNGQVYNGNVKLQGTNSPSGGVMWVNGNVSTKNHVYFTGMLIATGDIKIASHYHHTQHDDHPAVVSQNGNIKISGQLDADGVVFAQTGTIELTGGTNLHGAVLSWGDIKTVGNWGVVDFNLEDPITTGGDDVIELVAWEME